MTEKIKWIIDPNHSEVQFKVKHLGISNVSGTFKMFSGVIQSCNDDFSDAEVYFEIDSGSVDTNNTERDNHLKSPIFFDTARFPKIIFTGFIRKHGSNYTADVDLTMLKKTKNIKLDVEFSGTGPGRFNDTRAGFELKGKIYRKDFGLSFGLLTEAGSLVVGEEIKLHADIQLIKQMN